MEEERGREGRGGSEVKEIWHEGRKAGRINERRKTKQTKI